jgi:tricorn protease-like protein
VYSTVKNQRYYFAYDNGSLETRTSATFQRLNVYQNLGNIIEIISDDETFIIVSNKEGELIHISLEKDQAGTERTRTVL